MPAISVSALTLALTGVIVGTGNTAQAASAVHYVAMGDSYSAGVGAGSESGSCDRSPNAYPALWATANSVASFAFVACSGARTSDVIKNQVSSLTSATTLASIAIGGNDAGFSSLMETCVLNSTSTCESAVAAAVQFVNNTLPGLLDTTLGDIRAHAPNAKIIVLDYPDFYDLGPWFCVGLSSGDHRALDAGIDDLDGVLKTAAARNGDSFADVRSAFSGHELCDSSPWLHSVAITDIHESYHPTATGQQSGYLPVFTTAATKAGQ